MMLLCEVFLEQGVAQRSRKGDVEHTSGMDMSYFGITNSKLASAKAVRVTCDSGPRRYLPRELLNRTHMAGWMPQALLPIQHSSILGVVPSKSIPTQLSKFKDVDERVVTGCRHASIQSPSEWLR